MSYKAGIVKAIQDLGDRTGSSSIAIKKHMQERHPKDKKWQNATFLSSLKSGVESGDFVKNKNSYKLSADFKKKLGKAPAKKAAPKKKTVKAKVAAKKTAVKKKVTAAKKKKATATKKTAVKKKVTAAKKKVTKKATAAKKATKKKSTTKK